LVFITQMYRDARSTKHKIVLFVEAHTVSLNVCNIFLFSVLMNVVMVLGLGGLQASRKTLLADTACSSWGVTRDV